MQRISFAIFIFLLLSTNTVVSQISVFPYKENFDLLNPPSLPIGWTTTTNKNSNGDFTTSTTTVRTAPNALSTTDATKPQSVSTSYFNFKGKVVDSLEFYERRTSTHTSGLLIEASVGSDTTFPILIADTLKFINGTSYVRRMIPLPMLLNDKDSVRFRWRVVGNGSGTTGVLRIDDIIITVKKAVDLALTALTFSPNLPKQGDQISATIRIKNRALAGNFSGTVQLFDSLTFVSSQSFNHFFAVNESLAVVLNYPNIKTGRHSLNAKLLLSGDEDTTNNSVSGVINVGFRSRTLLINEFMYAPLGGMPEWIELVNNSSDTISISGWKISDAGSTKASILPTLQMIAPYSYVVITTDTLLLKNFFSFSVPLRQASFSALNNTTADAVVIFDPTNAMIDSVQYSPSWGGSGGRSLERIDTAEKSTFQSNWKSSVHPLGATPGTINSVTQKTFDGTVNTITISPLLPTTGNSITISSIIKNIGKQDLSTIQFQLFIDANNDSILTTNELQFQQNISSLSRGDSTIVTTTLLPLSQGKHLFGVKISSLTDEDTTNNIVFHLVTVEIPPKSIIINEVMFAPPGDMPEWIELYNNSAASISISQWKISDNGLSRTTIAQGSPLIPPQTYCVVASDSSFINFFPVTAPVFVASFSALNNTTPDAVVIYDERGSIMDSVYYRQSWGGLDGNSLQRFDFFGSSSDSLNWRTGSPNPGVENLYARKEIDAEVKNISTVKIANGIQIFVTIFNPGRQILNGLTVKFYHDKNRDSTAQEIELIDSSGASTIQPLDSITLQYNWNVQIQGKQSIIATVVTANDMRFENNSRQTIAKNNFAAQTLVINEIMYEPIPDKSEFVELFNRSTDTIDIAEWKLMDQPSSTGSRTIIPLSLQTTLVPPNGFVLIASDSSIVTQFPLLGTNNIIINGSLSLSNSGEDLVLVDLTDTPIDSVRYSPLWHLKNISSSGRSLERINPNISSNDARNWSSSVSPIGSTPAGSNSIFTRSIVQHSSLQLSPNPFSPDNDGFEDFLTINYSLPSNSAMIRVRIYDVTGRLIRRLAQNEPSASTGSIVWNGMDDDGNRVRIGMYIILFEALDNFGGTAKTMKDVAVVGRKL